VASGFMTASLLALWLSLSPPPAWTSAGPETVRVDWKRTVTDTSAPPVASTPVHTNRTTCVNRPRPLRPRQRHLVRVRRYTGTGPNTLATWHEIEVTPERWRALRLDAVVELHTLTGEDPDELAGWWP
jgi:hypothetical protein